MTVEREDVAPVYSTLRQGCIYDSVFGPKIRITTNFTLHTIKFTAHVSPFGPKFCSCKRTTALCWMVQGHWLPHDSPLCPVSSLSREQAAALERGQQTPTEGSNRADIRTMGFLQPDFHSPQEGWGVVPDHQPQETQFLPQQPPFLESIRLLRDVLQPGDHMGKVDFEDAYPTVQIVVEHRRYLRFRWSFQFKSLPFCLATAPRSF